MNIWSIVDFGVGPTRNVLDKWAVSWGLVEDGG